MRIEHTRALVNQALVGTLAHAKMTSDPIFGFRVPTEAAGIPAEVLDPRATWQDKEAYDLQARHLAQLFQDNFRQFEDQTPEWVAAAGPRIDGMEVGR